MQRNVVQHGSPRVVAKGYFTEYDFPIRPLELPRIRPFFDIWCLVEQLESSLGAGQRRLHLSDPFAGASQRIVELREITHDEQQLTEGEHP